MADIRIKDLTSPASSTASDDFIAVDGTTNGTRKLNAFSPTFGGNVVVTGTLTSQSTLSTAAGLSCANADITGGYIILRGYGSQDGGLVFFGQSANNNFINSNATTISTSIAGSAVSNNVAAGFRVLTTTASTTTSTGALVVSGGVGVGGAINVGGLLSASATTSLDGLPTAAIFGGTKRVVIGYNTSSDYGFIASADSGTTWKELHLNPSGGLVKVPSTSASTSTSSGALVVSGGVGVAGAVNAGTFYGLVDGVTAPGTESGYARIYVDSADGDLKVKFGDGTVKTIATDS